MNITTNIIGPVGIFPQVVSGPIQERIFFSKTASTFPFQTGHDFHKVHYSFLQLEDGTTIFAFACGFGHGNRPGGAAKRVATAFVTFLSTHIQLHSTIDTLKALFATAAFAAHVSTFIGQEGMIDLNLC